jgi:hypothetical protein
LQSDFRHFGRCLLIVVLLRLPRHGCRAIQCLRSAGTQGWRFCRAKTPYLTRLPASLRDHHVPHFPRLAQTALVVLPVGLAGQVHPLLFVIYFRLRFMIIGVKCS